jgi:Spy/CpxP family protein refolding chaperone
MKKILFLLFGLFSVSAFAGSAEMIYAWGYGDILMQTLTAVNFTFSSNDYSGIFKFALAIAVTMAFIATAQLGEKGDMLRLPKLFIMSFGISTLFVTWRIDVVVHDVNTNQDYFVPNVPWGVAKPLVWFTGMEEHIGLLMETTFAVPSDVSYSNGGFLSPFSVMDAAGSARITDPNLLQSIDGFIGNCVVPDIKTGYFDLTAIKNAEDIWSIFSDVNPAVVSYYYKTGKKPVMMNCQDLYNKINDDLASYINGQGMTNMSSMLGSYTAAQTATMLGASSNYFIGYSGSATDFLKQSIMINQFNDSYKKYATMNGMDSSSVAYGTGKGEQVAQANMVISGVLGSKYIPITKGILTVIFVGLTPIVALMMLTPMFWKVLSGYLVSLLWLSLWHIGEVILNFIILLKAGTYMNGITNAAGVYTLVSKPVVDSSYIDYVNMAGSMYWMIPSIAGLIVGGFSYMAASGLAGAVNGNVSSGPRGVATEVASGNASFGNVSTNNVNSNKRDTTNANAVGQSTRVVNTYDEVSGSNRSSNNTSSGMSVQIGKDAWSGPGIKASSNGDKVNLDRGSVGVNENGETINVKSPSTFLNGQMIVGDVLYGDKDGNTHEEIVNNGVRKAIVHNAKSGVTTTTYGNGGEGTQLNMEGQGGNIGFVRNGNGNYVITNADLKSFDISQVSSNNKTSSQTQTEMKNTQQAINKSLDGKDLTSSEFGLLYAAAVGTKSSNTSANSTGTTVQEQMINSIANDFVKTSGKSSSANQMKTHQVSGTDQSSYGVQVGAGVDGKKGLSGAASGFLSKIGINAGANAQKVWLSADAVTVSGSDGTATQYSLTNSQREQFGKSFSKILNAAHTDTYAKTKEGSTTITGSGGKKDAVSFTADVTKSDITQFATSLQEQYSDSNIKNVGVNDSKQQFFETLKSYAKDKKYEGGLESLANNLVSGKDEKLLKDVTEYAKNYNGIKEPKKVLTDEEKNSVDENASKTKTEVKKEVPAKTEGVFDKAVLESDKPITTEGVKETAKPVTNQINTDNNDNSGYNKQNKNINQHLDDQNNKVNNDAKSPLTKQEQEQLNQNMNKQTGSTAPLVNEKAKDIKDTADEVLVAGAFVNAGTTGYSAYKGAKTAIDGPRIEKASGELETMLKSQKAEYEDKLKNENISDADKVKYEKKLMSVNNNMKDIKDGKPITMESLEQSGLSAEDLEKKGFVAKDGVVSLTESGKSLNLKGNPNYKPPMTEKVLDSADNFLKKLPTKMLDDTLKGGKNLLSAMTPTVAEVVDAAKAISIGGLLNATDLGRAEIKYDNTLSNNITAKDTKPDGQFRTDTFDMSGGTGNISKAIGSHKKENASEFKVPERD